MQLIFFFPISRPEMSYLIAFIHQNEEKIEPWHDRSCHGQVLLDEKKMATSKSEMLVVATATVLSSPTQPLGSPSCETLGRGSRAAAQETTASAFFSRICTVPTIIWCKKCPVSLTTPICSSLAITAFWIMNSHRPYLQWFCSVISSTNWICCRKNGCSGIQRGLTNQAKGMLFVCHQYNANPFIAKSDQFQISPAASPEILHHTVWRTWLCIAYSRWKIIILPILTTSLILFSLKSWENVVYTSTNLDSCFGDGYCLLLHGLMNSHLVLGIHLIKLVNTAYSLWWSKRHTELWHQDHIQHTLCCLMRRQQGGKCFLTYVVCQHQSSSLYHKFWRFFVFDDCRRQTCCRWCLSRGVHTARAEFLHMPAMIWTVELNIPKYTLYIIALILLCLCSQCAVF